MKFLIQRCLPVLAVVAILPASVQAEQSNAGVKWNQDLKQAAAISQDSGKPMLVTFTASWCTYCHKLIGETFSDEQVAVRVNDCFVPVVLDADANERAVQLLQIEAFPTTLVISPELDLVGRIDGFHKAPSMIQRLQPFCSKSPEKLKKAVAASIPGKPDAQPAAGEKAAPQTAFSGMCLVSMLDDRRLIAGSPEITQEFRGVKLHFNSKKHRDTFLESPETYWPVADGHCPVASVTGEQKTLGDARTAAVYRDQVILFRSMKHRKQFAEDPRGFMSRLNALEDATAEAVSK